MSFCRYFNSVEAIGRQVSGRVRRQQETGEGQACFCDHYVVSMLPQVECGVLPPFTQSLIVIGGK